MLIELTVLTSTLCRHLKQCVRTKLVLHVADQFRPPLRPVLDKPLRLCMTDVFKAAGAGVAVAGMIHTGSVQAGDRVLVVPAGDTATVKGFY